MDRCNLPTSVPRRSVSTSADEGASSATDTAARALGWNRKGTLSSRTDTVRSKLTIYMRGVQMKPVRSVASECAQSWVAIRVWE